jgi:hypothetical protein
MSSIESQYLVRSEFAPQEVLREQLLERLLAHGHTMESANQWFTDYTLSYKNVTVVLPTRAKGERWLGKQGNGFDWLCVREVWEGPEGRFGKLIHTESRKVDRL